MAEKKMLKGNRLEELYDGESSCVLGYRLFTGPEGTECDDASYCGSARSITLSTKEYRNLRVYPQGVSDTNPHWPAWIVTYETGEPESAVSLTSASLQKKSYKKPATNKQRDSARPGSFWRSPQRS